MLVSKYTTHGKHCNTNSNIVNPTLSKISTEHSSVMHVLKLWPSFIISIIRLKYEPGSSVNAAITIGWEVRL